MHAEEWKYNLDVGCKTRKGDHWRPPFVVLRQVGRSLKFFPDEGVVGGMGFVCFRACGKTSFSIDGVGVAVWHDDRFHARDGERRGHGFLA